MVRIVKIVMIAAVAAWAFLGAFFNVYDWAGTTGAVAATVSMSTFEGGADDWRATTNPALIFLGALMIPLLKAASGILCAIGAVRMIGARKGGAASFAAAKEFAIAGCGVAMILLFGGWIVLAETWYELWRSDPFRDMGLQSAFRYGAMITLIALYVGMREE